VPEEDEEALHSAGSLKADPETADHYGQLVVDNYIEEEIDAIVARWYLT